MKALIVSKRELSESSLALKVFDENGKTFSIKIPGILKSKKRSGYFFFPGTIWQFTILQNPSKMPIPRESDFLFSPYAEKIDYHELEQMSRFLKPLQMLPDGYEISGIFPEVEELLAKWAEFSISRREILILKNYINFLIKMGVLNLNDHCSECGNDGRHGYFVFNEGIICVNCLSLNSNWKAQSIPLDDIQQINGAMKISEDQSLNRKYGNTLLNIIKNSFS